MRKEGNLDAAILVFGCDRYQLLFKGFEYFFQKYWDHSLNLPKYVSTEQTPISMKSFEYIPSGSGAWADRLVNTLSQINQQYIIFIQEDMWFSNPLPSGILKEVLAYTISNGLPLVKIHSSPHYVLDKGLTSINGYTLSSLDKSASNFLMSHQISIWDKDLLIQQLKPNEHPWRNERKGTKRLRKSQIDIYQIDLFSENGNRPNNINSADSQYSEYWTVSENAILNPKAKPFIEELKDFDETYAKTLEYKMENQLTHDNKARPRKQDIFKKIKVYLKRILSSAGD
jgi:hypothetical protein